jgi:hypothetical protein
LPDHLRPTFARYTGQESADERKHIAEAKPDILLTNFMMLELLMTRQNTLDRAMIANCHDAALPLALDVAMGSKRLGASARSPMRDAEQALQNDTGAVLAKNVAEEGR